MPSFAVPAASLLSAYDHVLLDLDGCVWVGDEPTPRAPEAVTALRDGAARASRSSRTTAATPSDEYVRKLWRLGFRASREEVVTVGGALQFVARGVRAPAPRTSSARPPCTATSSTPACGSSTARTSRRAPTSSSSPRTTTSTTPSCAARSRPSCAAPRSSCAGRDATFPMPDGPWPGAGPIVAAIEAGHGRDGGQRRQARAAALPHRARPARARAARSSSATASTPTLGGRARRRPRLRDRPHRRDERRRGARRRPGRRPTSPRASPELVLGA